MKDQNVTVNFTFDASEHNMSPSEWKYEEVIEYKRSVKDAILFIPSGPYGHEEAFETANKKGIKTVLLDRITESDCWDAAYIPNNYNDGRYAAQEMIKKLESDGIYSGKICLIGFLEDDDTACQREEGFRSVFENTNYELMETAYLFADYGRESEYIQKLIDNGETENIVGYANFVVSPNLSIPKVFSEQPYDPDDSYKYITPVVLMFGVYTDIPTDFPYIVEYFCNGTLDISINTDPYQMGYQGMMGAVELLRGNEIDPKIVDVAPVVVTSDNCLQYFAEVDSQVKSARSESDSVIVK